MKLKSTLLFVFMCAVLALVLATTAAYAQTNPNCPNQSGCGTTSFGVAVGFDNTSFVGTLNSVSNGPPYTSPSVGLSAACNSPLVGTYAASSYTVTNPCSYNAATYMYTYVGTGTHHYVNAYGAMASQGEYIDIYQWNEAADCNLYPSGGNGFFYTPYDSDYGC